MDAVPSQPLGTMIARVSPEDILIYGNAALAAYLQVPKDSLPGTPLEVLAGRCQGEISSCFLRPEGGRTSNRLVTDDAGRVFEAKTYSDGGVLDIVIDEVTTSASVSRDLSYASGVSPDALSEEELRTARLPERRYLTVGFSLLRGVAALTEKLPAMEVRVIVSSFLEECAEATLDTGCTVGGTSGESVLSIFGAPRYFADHPLRAIRAACAMQRKWAVLHASFAQQGKELSPCSFGFWTGDTLVGTMGGAAHSHYTAVGQPTELAERLARLARPGEILLPEHTLTHLLRVLPPGWKHLRAESESEPDLSDFQWAGEEITLVPEQLRKTVYLLGPALDQHPDQVEFYFDYLWALTVPGKETPVPILRVVRPEMVGDSIELRPDNIVADQAVQTLGKYKLIEVVGTGGMGRVWRGVDRFGNVVAIKVLHSTEIVSDAQLKRFRREAEVMARLPHRNICRVYEMNEFEGIQYLAMEFVDGLTLSDLLYETLPSDGGSQTVKIDLGTLIRSIRTERTQRASLPPPEEGEPEPEEEAKPKVTRILPVEQTLKIVLRVCDAIQFAHEHGVLHRDLKPGNILLREDGEPLVADFGLAKLSSPDATHSLSVSGHVVGTMENMSPEQAESSKDVDERADVYSLGTVLFQMLTGHRHFAATGNIMADAQALRTHEPPKLRSYNPAIDPDLEIITLKALRNSPVERYRNVAALREDLERYRRGEVISAKPVSALDLFRKLVQRNKAVSGVVAGSLLLLVSTTVVFLWQLSSKLAAEKKAVQEAEELRILAEDNRRLAEEKQKEAEEKARNAEEQRLRAEALLEEKKVAEAGELAAKESSKLAQAETLTEREKRQHAEEEATRHAEALAESQREIEQLRAASVDQGPIESPPEEAYTPDAATRKDARRAMSEAQTLFLFELSPFELQRLEKDPGRALVRLSAAMNEVSKALLADPLLVPGWLLKGRIHLSLMEYDRALKSFEKANALAASGGWEGEDDIPALMSLTNSLSRAMGNQFVGGIQSLRDTGLGPNQTVAALLEFLSNKPALRKSSTSALGPFARVPTPSETALALTEANRLTFPAVVDDLGMGRVKVSLTPDAGDLSALKALNVSVLTMPNCQTIDWDTIVQLSLEGLDVSGCELEALPFHQRGYLRIRSLNLANTHISSIEVCRNMPLLESLDLTRTDVTDLSPLANNRNLRSLNITGLNPNGLRVLASLPLESLTLSPLLIADKSSLDVLRMHRTLKVLRTAEDPETLSPTEFWRKLESGGYDESE